MSESVFYKVARLSVKAAVMLFPVNENALRTGNYSWIDSMNFLLILLLLLLVDYHMKNN